MDHSASPSAGPCLAERIAWLHAPVRLTPGHLPWVLRKLLEAVLHHLFCTLEQTILTVHELRLQGKLQPWPEAEPPEACERPRVARYRMKASRTSPERSAVVAQDTRSAEVLPLMVAEAGVEEGAEAVGEVALIERCPAVSCREWLGRLPPAMWPAVSGPFRLPDRCWSAGCLRAAWMRRDNCVQIVPVI